MSSVQGPGERDWPSNPLTASQTLPQLTPAYGCPHGTATKSCSTELSRDQARYLPPSPHPTNSSKRVRKMPKSSTLSVTLSHPSVMANDCPDTPVSPRVRTPSNHESFMSKDVTAQSNAFHSEFSASAVSLSREPAGGNELPRSPTFASLPPHPGSPKSTPKTVREPSHSFFSNVKASKSSIRIEPADVTIRHVAEERPPTQAHVAENGVYSMRRTPGSTPDLSNPKLSNTERTQTLDHTDQASNVTRPPAGNFTMSDSMLLQSSSSNLASKRSKPKFPRLLARTRSIRLDEPGRRFKLSNPTNLHESESSSHSDTLLEQRGLKTAPLHQERDRSFRDLMGSNIRNRSADRPERTGYEASYDPMNPEKNDSQTALYIAPTVFKDGAGTKLFANFKSTSAKAADGIGKAGKGLLGKITRSGNNSSKDVLDDEHYVFSVIKLPLVEQTRRTRIAKRLEDSKDKTEFWMPALPWRCIDYLNFRGCEEEGLYRVPGSGPRIKEWQRRFDRELDINLFDEPDLYDINIIGSIFKAWLRDLPDEIFPKAIQAKIAVECKGASTAPQMLKDELSKLPPWNYYLLFAITCHLSLLNSYVDKNKMNFSNLCICFQPCLKMDLFCFQFLVCDWRNCWQGCWTEKQALTEEYVILDGLPTSAGGSSGASTYMADERMISSSDSSKPSVTGNIPDRNKTRPPALTLTKPSLNDLFSEKTEQRRGPDQGRLRSATIRLARDNDRDVLFTPQRDEGEQPSSASRLPELAPVMPLSPLGI